MKKSISISSKQLLKLTIDSLEDDKGIDIIKLLNDVSYYKHVQKRVNSRGSLEFQYKQ